MRTGYCLLENIIFYFGRPKLFYEGPILYGQCLYYHTNNRRHYEFNKGPHIVSIDFERFFDRADRYITATTSIRRTETVTTLIRTRQDLYYGTETGIQSNHRLSQNRSLNEGLDKCVAYRLFSLNIYTDHSQKNGNT